MNNRVLKKKNLKITNIMVLSNLGIKDSKSVQPEKFSLSVISIIVNPPYFLI